MTHRRPLGPGVDREHQDVADVTPHRPAGRTAAERVADLAAPLPPADTPGAPTGRRTLAVREP
ncbi:hypothetical protein ACFC26_43145 [Kitasatospora purpeofusca]|uniref:hypothetical protein n=1 Tax=Kitasatospora purpeofusca TaxID=67352 RepID=UPI0035DC11CE